MFELLHNLKGTITNPYNVTSSCIENLNYYYYYYYYCFVVVVVVVIHSLFLSF